MALRSRFEKCIYQDTVTVHETSDDFDNRFGFFENELKKKRFAFVTRFVTQSLLGVCTNPGLDDIDSCFDTLGKLGGGAVTMPILRQSQSRGPD